MMFGSFARMWRLRDTDSPERYGLLLPVLAVCSLLPLLSGFRYGFDGVDVNYHFDSWIDMVRCWRSGVLLPGWAQQANYGLGDPLPIWGVSKFRAQNMKLKGFKMPTEEQVTIERQSADTRMSDRMKILYVAPLKPGNTSLYRQEALNRLGHTTISFATNSYEPRSRVMNKLRYRWPVGRLISRVNRELLTAVQAERPSIVWFDKPTAFTPETIKAVKSMGAKTVCYNQDNPFGPREDGCWLQFKRVYQLFDLHCLFRTVDDKRYRRWGLPAIKIALSHDSQQHFPPPAPWSDEQRIREVSIPVVH